MSEQIIYIFSGVQLEPAHKYQCSEL